LICVPISVEREKGRELLESGGRRDVPGSEIIAIE
jgi:hypothetical protein